VRIVQETGIGEWSEDTFIAVMRTGKHQGQPNGPHIKILRYAEGELRPSSIANDYKFTPAYSIGKSFKPYRKLRVVVSPEQLVVSFDGRHVQTLSRGRLENFGESLFRDAAAKGYEFDPEGGIGLYADRSPTESDRVVDRIIATFRNVVVRQMK